MQLSLSEVVTNCEGSATVPYQLVKGQGRFLYISLGNEWHIKMHKFPALNLNKNANETLWVLIMQRTSFLLFAKETFQERFLNM